MRETCGKMCPATSPSTLKKPLDKKNLMLVVTLKRSLNNIS